MTEQPPREAVPQPDREPSPMELASSFLNYRSGEISRKIQETDRSMHFTRTYEPKPLPPRPIWAQPGGDSGSGDVADWDAEEGAYRQWPEEQEAELQAGETRLDELYGELDMVDDYREKVAEGDKGVTEQFAALERERRAKIEEQERRKEEKRRLAEEGVEFEGSDEVAQQLQETFDAIRDGQIREGQRGANGWELYRHWPSQDNNYSGLRTHNNEHAIFELKQEGKAPTVTMRVGFDVNEGVHMTIDDFRGGETIPSRGSTIRQDRKGVRLECRIREDRVLNPYTRDVYEDRPYGYPEVHQFGPPYEGRKMEQEQFDEVKQLVGDMSSGLAASSQ